jgi:hypothetical protein
MPKVRKLVSSDANPTFLVLASKKEGSSYDDMSHYLCEDSRKMIEQLVGMGYISFTTTVIVKTTHYVEE